MTTTQHAGSATGTDSPSRADLHSRITNKIIADLEQGVRPWHRPWNAAHLEQRIIRPLRHNGIPYQGINTVMLWMAAATNGYGSPFWMTFRQAKELGGNVRKGEHGELVVYADRITRHDTNAEGEDTERTIPFLKGYTVFNADQCENLPVHFTAKPEALRWSPLAGQIGGFAKLGSGVISGRQFRCFYSSDLGRGIRLVRSEPAQC